MIGTFLDLNQSGNLGNKDGPQIPTLADTTEFTTTFSGSASPSIEIRPVLGRGWQFASAGVTAEASRDDIHKLIIAISLPPESAVAKGRAARPGRTIAKQRAIDELDRQEDREFISETRRLRRQLREVTD